MAQRFRELAALLETQVQFPAPTWQSTTVHDSSSMCVFCLNTTCLCTTVCPWCPWRQKRALDPWNGAINAVSHHVGAGNWRGLCENKSSLLLTHFPSCKERKKFFCLPIYFFFKLFLFILHTTTVSSPFPPSHLLPIPPHHPLLWKCKALYPSTEQTDKENVAHLHNRVLLSCIKQWIMKFTGR